MTSPDKSKELVTKVTLVNDRVQFEGHVDGQPSVAIDYAPPLGDEKGYTSLELLLLSLSSCLGTAVATFLRRMNREVAGLEIMARGERKSTHPTGFHTIHLDVRLTSSDASVAELEKTVASAEQSFCPVFAMVKNNVEIVTTVDVVK
ncbi:MAG: OsmC family protein [Deltaproteobacteria bacterium]|nr:OsmC family protein [Deltaproteobacteria bacterium]